MRWLHASRRIANSWFANDNSSAAAAIAFYSLFTLAPTLIFGVTAGAWILGRDEAQRKLREALGSVLTSEQADAILALVENTGFARGGVVATAAAAILLIYGASATFEQLRISLNRIFGHSAETIREQIHTSLLGRLTAALFVILVGVLELAIIGFNVILGKVAVEMSRLGWFPVDVLRLIGEAASWLVIGLLFAGLLRFLPMRPQPWWCVVPGAAVALVLFQAGRYLIGLYLSHTFIASAYGTSSSLVAIMIWIYYSSQTLLLGAEITNELAEGRGDPA